jgi:hypothetical protein
MTIIKNVMADLLVEQFKSAMGKKKHIFFDSRLSYNLNIIGVRKKNVIYRNDDKEWEVLSAAATTDPGSTTLFKPLNRKGTAILVPGQYRGSHKIDLHAGKYAALRQTGAKVKVWRDDDKDSILDMDDSKIEEGYFGINIHRASRRGETALVNSYSAGCQVFQAIADFREFMELCETGALKFTNNFTYTLLEEEDFS